MIIFVDCIKNRRKDEWRDRHEPTVDVNVARPDPADPEAPAVEPGPRASSPHSLLRSQS